VSSAGGFEEGGSKGNGFGGAGGDDDLLDEHETRLFAQDLVGLTDFSSTFGAEGYGGLAVWRHGCVDEHYLPRGTRLVSNQPPLETGGTTAHAPAFRPEAHRCVPRVYARELANVVGMPLGEREPAAARQEDRS
jgi:hypothetical protein